MDSATRDYIEGIAILIGPGLGYALSRIRTRRRMEESPERRQHPTLVTVTVDERLEKLINPKIEAAISREMGFVRRQMSDASSVLSVHHAKVMEALAQWQMDKEIARQERNALSERLGALLRATEAQIKTSEAQTKATTEFDASVKGLLKLFS